MPERQPEIKLIKDVSMALQRGKGNRETESWGNAVFLIGAGCSAGAGIPLAKEISQECVIELSKKYSNGQEGSLEADQALEWLKKQQFFGLDVSWENAYGYIFEKHYTDPREQQEIIQRAVKKARGINWAHLCLGELVFRRYIHTVLTTNFDQLVLEGIIRTGLIPVVADGIESLNRIKGEPKHPQVIHLHGSMHTYSPRNSFRAVQEIEGDISTTSALYHLLQSTNLFVVVGYGGGEEAVMKLLIESAKQLQNKTIFWVQYGSNPDDLSPRAKEFLKESHNSGLILGQDADDFFRQIMRNLGLGKPEWMRDPVDFLQKGAEKIVRLDNSDIRAEVETYQKDLKTLQTCREQTKLDPKSRALAISRDLRLSGNLSAALETLRPLKKESKDPEFWEMFATTAYEIGEGDPEPNHLNEAIAAFRRLLEYHRKESSPDSWAMTMTQLGSALAQLGEREEGTKRLEEAVDVFRAALEVYTRDRVPLDWARTMNNLGNTLQRLGERDEETKRLQEAVDVFRTALEVRTRDSAPLDWARTMNNLGNALRNLGEREKGTKRFEEAVDVYRAALEVRTRDRVPFNWATTMNNLGNALLSLGEREEGTKRLEEAVDVFRAALEVNTRDHVPLNWATTMNNLGGALAQLGEKEEGTKRFEEAVDVFRAALEVRTRDRVPFNWATTMNNLGNALLSLGEREKGTKRFEEAVDVFRAVLEVRARDSVPLDWANIMNNLGSALTQLGEREEGTKRLEEAVEIYKAALSVLQDSGAEYYIGICQRGLQDAQRLIEKRIKKN